MVRGGNPHQNGVLRFMNYWYNTNVFFENINIEIKEVEESEDTLDVMYSGIYNLYFRAEGESIYYIYEIAIWYNLRFLIDDLKNNIFNPSITYDETIEMNVEEEEYNLCLGCGVIMTEDNSNPGDDYCGDCKQGIDKVMNS